MNPAVPLLIFMKNSKTFIDTSSSNLLLCQLQNTIAVENILVELEPIF